MEFISDFEAGHTSEPPRGRRGPVDLLNRLSLLSFHKCLLGPWVPLPNLAGHRVCYFYTKGCTDRHQRVVALPESGILVRLSIFCSLCGGLCDRHLSLSLGLFSRLVTSCLAPRPSVLLSLWLPWCPLERILRARPSEATATTSGLASGQRAETVHGRHQVSWQGLHTRGRPVTTRPSVQTSK